MKLVEKFCTPFRKLRLHDVKLTGVCREDGNNQALLMLFSRSIPIILCIKEFVTYAILENPVAVTTNSKELLACDAV
jgi:hypothetical protein